MARRPGVVQTRPTRKAASHPSTFFAEGQETRTLIRESEATPASEERAPGPTAGGLPGALGGLVGVDLSIANMDHAVRVFGDVRFMGH